MTTSNPTYGKGMFSAPTLAHEMAAAVLAGQFAGLVMAAAMMLVFGVILGENPLMPVAIIGATVYGEPALTGLHIPAILSGLVLHQLGPALFWSVVFGLCVHLFKLSSIRSEMFLGLCIGAISQLVDVNLLVPLAYSGDNIWAREVPMAWSWAAHLVYGLCLGAYPLIEERLELRRRLRKE